MRVSSCSAAILITWYACGTSKNRIDTVITCGRSVLKCRGGARFNASLVCWPEACDVDNPGSVPTPTVANGTVCGEIGRSIARR